MNPVTEGALHAPPVPRAGDTLPDSVGALLAAFATGDVDAATACFAPGALWAPPRDEADEVGARALHEGGAAIRAALAADPQLGHAHTVRVCVTDGSDCLLEGDILDRSGAVVGSHGADFQLDGRGLIARALVFRIEAVEDNAGTNLENVSGVDIQAKLDEYFVELDAARFENAASHFSADGLYLHPPYAPGTPRVAYRGGEELLAGFERRGAQDWLHFTDVSIQRGPFLMFEGHVLVDGTPEGPTGSFISSATVDEEGKVLRYLAFYTAPMVPRR